MTRYLGFVLAFMMIAPASALAEEGTAGDDIAKGRELAFERAKGNCLACHVIEGGELAGSYGPPLIAMKARFPERSVLRAQVWDASVRMPDTRMPPYGRHRILTEDEIDLIVDFLLTL